MNRNTIAIKTKSIYRDLNDRQKKIADFIIENPEAVMHGTISTISDTLGIADSTFFRFIQKLGYSGFQEFKIALATPGESNNNPSIYEHVQSSDDELTIARTVFDSNIKALQDTKGILNADSFKKASIILNAANSVYFFGISGSGVVAYDAYHKFLRAPIKSEFNFDYHMQLMMAAKLTENDCAIIISHSGLTTETIQLAKIVKENGGKIIVITSYSLSELAKYADVCFISTSEEIQYRSEALSSRITQLSILDSLYVAYMFNNEEKANESLRKIRKAITNVKSKPDI